MVARMPRFNLLKHDVRLEGRDRPEHADAVGRGRLARAVDRRRCASWIDAGVIRPLVAEAFPFDRAPEAHRLHAGAPQHRQGSADAVAAALLLSGRMSFAPASSFSFSSPFGGNSAWRPP